MDFRISAWTFENARLASQGKPTYGVASRNKGGARELRKIALSFVQRLVLLQKPGDRKL
jgi:hypothetical protein